MWSQRQPGYIKSCEKPAFPSSSRLECQLRCELIQSDADNGNCKLFNYHQHHKLCQLSFCSPPTAKKKRSLGSTFTAWETYLRVERDEEELSKLAYKGKLETCQGLWENGSCCTAKSPCGLGGGDCDKDTDCEGSLACGKNNCRKFWKGAMKYWDCCFWMFLNM